MERTLASIAPSRECRRQGVAVFSLVASTGQARALAVTVPRQSFSQATPSPGGLSRLQPEEQGHGPRLPLRDETFFRMHKKLLKLSDRLC